MLCMPGLTPTARLGWLLFARGLVIQSFVLVHHSLTGQVSGLLPLAYVRSFLFGKFLISLPYVNTGGVWATTDEAASELITRACQFADEKNVRYLELRHERPVHHPLLNASREDKVHMRLALPATAEELAKSFKSKLRSQIKKSQQHGLSIRWGGRELLQQFYQVFAVNMRDLGTPVFSLRLFDKIMENMPGESEFCVVRKDDLPIAAGLLVHRDGVTEVPSASSLRAFNYTSANMWMYHNMLSRAIERKSRVFDFGRSSQDSGTYKFKAQWGAEPQPAIWQYYLRRGSQEDMRADSAKNKRLVSLWKKLPVPITRLIGPSIVRGIP